ncbi:MAG TPA: NINE protein, partial [Saliniramus sp.]|nr:NINE protein [Saliniramus sp.]
MALNTQEQILIEQRVANEAKSTGVAYLLWLFLGGLGGHRFYLGRTGSAVAMLLLTLVGAITLIVGVGVVILLGTGVWVLVDAFMIPGMVQQQKNDVRQQ